MKKSIKEIGFWKELNSNRGTNLKPSSYSLTDEEKAVQDLVFNDFNIGLDNINQTYPYYQGRNVLKNIILIYIH